MSDTTHHYLITKWTEDPANPTWGDQYDWELSHPPTCEFTRNDDDIWAGYQCWEQHELNAIGRSAFGPVSDWPRPPFMCAVEAYVDKGWAADDVVTGIRLVEEEGK